MIFFTYFYSLIRIVVYIFLDDENILPECTIRVFKWSKLTICVTVVGVANY